MLKYAAHESGNDQITAETMNGAIKLAEYYKQTGLRAAAIISQTSPANSEPKDFQALYEALPPRFKKSEAKELAKRYGVHERRLERKLADKTLFTKTSHGEYTKAA